MGRPGIYADSEGLLSASHKSVTLTADVMFVNGIAFLITFLRNIRLVTTEHIPSCVAKHSAKSVMK